MNIKVISEAENSDKTKFLIDFFVKNISRNPLLIVPSAEISFSIKKKMLTNGVLPGIVGRRIMTFDNLVNILCENAPQISSVKKIHVFREIVNSQNLRYFMPVSSSNGFYEVLSSFISELKQGIISPDDFRIYLSKKGMSAKDEELCMIYEQYERRLAKSGLLDHEGKFQYALNIIKKGLPEVFSDTKILLIDGFRNFSPVETEIINGISGYVEETIARKMEVDITAPAPFLNIISCPSQDTEIEEIAARIKRFILEGVNPDNIAVLFRDLSVYNTVTARVFSKYGIPFYSPLNKYLKDTQIIKFIMTIFDVVFSGYSRESVFSLLKSNYYFDNEGADEFYEKSLKAGIIEGRLNWDKRMPDNPFRKIFGLMDTFTQEPSVSGLKNIVHELGTDKVLLSNRDPLLAAQEISAYNRFIESLDEFSDVKFSCLEEFYWHVKMIIENIQCKSFYPNTPAVQVLDVHRARGMKFSVVFIPGMIEKYFPKQISEEPFYNDYERKELRDIGLNLTESKDKQEEELILFYSAVNTGIDKVIFTYPAADSEGREQLPSHFLDKVRDVSAGRINYETVHMFHPVPDAEYVYSNEYLFPSIVLDICKNTSNGADGRMYNMLINKKDRRFMHIISDIFSAERNSGVLKHKDSLKILSDIYNTEYTFSISQFDEYGICPFVYFCKRLLYLERIKPPEEDLSPIDEGNLYHKILWRFFTGLRDSRNGNTVMTGEDYHVLNPRMKEIADEEFVLIESQSMTNNSVLWDIKKREILKNLSEFLMFECKNSNQYKRPAYFELAFGAKKNADTDPNSTEQPLVINSVKIQGKIDRVDVIKPYMFSVVDYKSGSAEIKPADILDGTNIQLPIYVLAVKNLFLKDMEPYEAYFCHLKSKKLFYANPLQHYKKKKINSKWDEYMEEARKYVKEYADSIRKGIFSVKPDGKCPDYCEYRQICDIH